MAFIAAQNTVSGREGQVIATINGRVETLFEVESFDSEVELEKQEIRTLGNRAQQHKVIGWSGTGTMTVKYISSRFRQIIVDYINTGRMPTMTLVGTNNDVQSRVGAQTISLSGVIIDGSEMFKLDIDEGELTEEISFTYTGVTMLDRFGRAL